MDIEQLDQLIGGVGALDDAIDGITRDQDNRWTVAIGEVAAVIEHDPLREVLRISTDLGAPDAKSAPALYEAMLIYNTAGRETGDVVMALTEPGGALLQTLVLPLAGLTAQTLVVPLANMARTTLMWRAAISAGLAPPPPVAFSPTETFLRV